MLQKLIMAGAVATGIAGSQFPEFSQQYLQRLGGQFDALTQVAADFDASATKAGLTRDAALAEIKGSAFQDAHRADMAHAFTRLERITADLTLLRAANPLERMALPHRFRDTETLAAVWADFRPAVPVTVDGALATVAGGAAGWMGLTALFALLGSLFRKRRTA